MITTLKSKDVYTVLSWLTSITDLVEVFDNKPDDKYVETLTDTAYMYIDMPNDIGSVSTTNQWFMKKLARVRVTIFCIDASVDAWVVLWSIIDAINNAIATEGCNKIFDWNGVGVSEVVEDVWSPLLFDNRNYPYVTKDYLFSYSTK